MNDICWPTDVCFRVKSLKNTCEVLQDDINSLEKKLEISETNLVEAIKHISSLISNSPLPTSYIQQMALNFIFAVEG